MINRTTAAKIYFVFGNTGQVVKLKIHVLQLLNKQKSQHMSLISDMKLVSSDGIFVVILFVLT